jgi:hypothetical protein
LWPPAAIPTLRWGAAASEAQMDRRRRASETDRPRVEPEIIPPDDVRWRRADPRMHGAQRVYVARIGPVGFAIMAIAIGLLAALFFILLLSAFVVLLPLAGLALAIVIGVALLRVFWRRL